MLVTDLCNDEGCPRQAECFRFTPRQTMATQFFFERSPREGDQCAKFYELEPLDDAPDMSWD
jgi:hypothetical protein